MVNFPTLGTRIPFLSLEDYDSRHCALAVHSDVMVCSMASELHYSEQIALTSVKQLVWTSIGDMQVKKWTPTVPLSTTA